MNDLLAIMAKWDSVLGQRESELGRASLISVLWGITNPRAHGQMDSCIVQSTLCMLNVFILMLWRGLIQLDRELKLQQSAIVVGVKLYSAQRHEAAELMCNNLFRGRMLGKCMILLIQFYELLYCFGCKSWMIIWYQKILMVIKLM